MWIKFVDNYSSIDLVCESSRKTPKTQDWGPLEKSLAVVCRGCVGRKKYAACASVDGDARVFGCAGEAWGVVFRALLV